MLAGSHGQRNRGWGHEAGIPERREGDKADPIVHQLFPPDNRWVLKLQGQEVLTEGNPRTQQGTFSQVLRNQGLEMQPHSEGAPVITVGFQPKHRERSRQEPRSPASGQLGPRPDKGHCTPLTSQQRKCKPCLRPDKTTSEITRLFILNVQLSGQQ